MMVKIKAKEIRKALELACSVIERKNTMPVLGNIKLKAVSGDADTPQQLEMNSTDMFMSLKSLIAADNIDKEGVITVPANTLHGIVSKVDGEDMIVLTAGDEGKAVKIDLPFSNFSLPTLPVEDFPSLESNDNYQQFEIDSSILLSLFNRTKHAVSNEEIRYYLNGVYLHTVQEDDTKYLVAVATDGHRLAKVKAVANTDMPDIEGVIIHKKTITEVIKLLEASVGNITVGISSNKIMFKNQEHNIVSKVVDGKFPDYSRAIPSQCDKECKVATKDLADAIDLVTAVSNDRQKIVKMNIRDAQIMISTSSEFDGARGNQKINAEYNGTSVNFGFNARYVLNALSNISGSKVQLSFTDSMAPVVCEDPDDPFFVAILMPMQV